tara:strand:- start:419 stop:709 length:291 start_codon:yes stop_codon:yes gene_type:complete
MKNQTTIFYDFDKGFMINKPKISKNLLNANYSDIIRTKKKINKIDMYLHTAHKTDTYYKELYNNKNLSKKPEYKIDTSLNNLPYSEKIKRWKEIIS